MSNILFVVNGPPSSGKGTFLPSFLQICPMPSIIVGDICRAEESSNSATWREVKEFMSKTGSTFWPDDLLIWAFMSYIRSDSKFTSGHLVLDAFPYSMPQTEALKPIVNEFGFTRLVSIEIALDDEECIRRAKERKRNDDHLIRKRLSEYREITVPALDAVMYLSDKNLRVERIIFNGDMKANAPFYAEGLKRIYNL